MQQSPSIWVIILTWNQWAATRECLTSLQQATYDNLSFLVVDNASSDETVAQLTQNFPNVLLIENNANLGFGAGCNVGIQFALAHDAEYVMLLNNDAIVSPEVFDTLLAHAVALPNAAILTPQLRSKRNPSTIWFTGSRRSRLLFEAKDIGPVQARRSMPVDAITEVDYVFGTAMFIGRNTLEAVGGFDQRYFLYYEDLDLCLSVQQLGKKLYYVPDAIIYHQVSQSTEDNLPMRYYHRARSSVLFFRKWVYGWRVVPVVAYRFFERCTYLWSFVVNRQLHSRTSLLAWHFLMGCEFLGRTLLGRNTLPHNNAINEMHCHP